LSVTVSNGIATLSWTAPAGPLGSQAAYSYYIYEGSAQGAEATTPAYTGITATGIKVAAPAAGAGTYYFEVTALNGNGESAPSNEVNASLATLAIPSTPVLSAATAGPGTVALSWGAVGTDTTYSIFEGTAAGGESSAPVQGGVTTPYVTVTGLTNGTRYYFTVVATNPAGTSATSSELSAVPTPEVVATSSSGSTSSSTKVSTTQASSTGGGGLMDSWELAALASLCVAQRWRKRFW
jgi:predicted phage tail protein